MQTEHSVRPVAMAALGVALFSLLDAIMKVIAGAYPLAQATGMRYCAVAVIAAIFYAGTTRMWPSRAAIRRSIPRSVANLAAGTCFFFAISRLALVDAVALTFLSPLFLAMWGWMLLGERLSPSSLVSLAVGFVGVILMVQGQYAGIAHRVDLAGFAAAMATAALYALSMAITRGHSSSDTTATLVLLPSLIGALLAAPAMILAWQPVSAWHLQLIVCVGLLGTGGFLCLAWAYSHANVNRLGLFDYTGLVWALAIGYAVFHEMPSLWTLAGALLIIIACLPAFFMAKTA